MNLFYGAELSDYKIEAEPGDVTEVADPLGSGETVFSLTVPNDHTAGFTENPRAQLLGPDIFNEGDEFWLETFFLMPSDYPPLTGFLALVEVYGEPFAGSSPFRVEAQGGSFFCERNDTYGGDTPWEIPMVKGQWVNVVIHERFATDGWVELWIDGEQQVFFEGTPEETTKLEMQTRDSSNNGAANHAKLSHYRKKDQFEVGTIYFKPLSLATTKAELDPEAEPEGPTIEAPELTGAPVVLAGASATSATINAPAVRDKDDGLVVSLWLQSTTPTPSTPAGWTMLGSVTRTGKFKEWFWARPAADDATDNFSTTWTGSTFRFGEMRRVTGNVPAIAEWIVGTGSNDASPVATVNSVSTKSAGNLLIAFYNTAEESTVKSATAGWVGDGATWTPIYSKEQPAEGPSGVLEITFEGAGEDWIGLMIAIPAPEPPAPAAGASTFPLSTRNKIANP